MSRPEIYIALPVYRGVETVPETLRSIRDQTFREYRVAISVDANDQASAEACRPFLSDSRVNLVIQPRRLDWAGNMNWLIERCDCPYFCYWQQDDLTATNYLATLREELLAHPETAIAYTDVQWFGARFGRDGTASIEGAAPTRVLQAAESLRFEPLRGLIRSEWLPRHDAIPEAMDEGCHAEFIFLTQLAACGSFRRVPETLYFKRAHSENTFSRWHNWPPFRRRRSWIDMGIGILRVAREVVTDPRYQRRLLASILDRLMIPRGTRSFFCQTNPDDPADCLRFVRDFISRGSLTSIPVEPAGAFEETTAAFFAPIHPHVDAGLESMIQAARKRDEFAERLQSDGRLKLPIHVASEGTALLADGWSPPEDWGVWNDGQEARLFLPSFRAGRWQIKIRGRHFADARRSPGTPVRVAWRVGEQNPFRTESFTNGERIQFEATVATKASAEPRTQWLELQFPDAVYLPDAGVPDKRQVGFGLELIELARLE